MTGALIAGLRTSLLFVNGLSWLGLGAIHGAAFLGQAGYALALSALAVACASLGVDSAVYYLRRTSRRLATYLLAIRAISTIVVSIIVFVVVHYSAMEGAGPLFALSCSVLCISTIVNFIEARRSSTDGPAIASLLLVKILPFSLAARFLVADLTHSIAFTLLALAAFDLLRCYLLWTPLQFAMPSLRRTSFHFRVSAALVSRSKPLFLVGIYNVYLQKALPIFSTWTLGPVAAGIVVAHTTIFDAYANFCATLSQFVYSSKKLDSTTASLERALRPISILSWVSCLLLVVALLAFSSPIQIGSIVFEPIYLTIAATTMFAYSFGSIFGHWVVVSGEMRDLPKFYLATSISITMLMGILFNFGIIGIIASKSLSWLLGNLAVSLIFVRYRFIRGVLCKVLIYPLSLTR